METMKKYGVKRLLSLLLTLCMLMMCMVVLPVQVLAADASVTYLDEFGAEKTVTATLIKTSTDVDGDVILSDTDTNGGWYTFEENIECYNVKVSGNVKLILPDGLEFKATGIKQQSAGIRVDKNDSLTIYGQEHGTGKLVAKCGRWDGAGIGMAAYTPWFPGDITIRGGTVTAQGGLGAAGIGSGASLFGTYNEDAPISEDDTSGNITITGGTVTATGGNSGNVNAATAKYTRSSIGAGAGIGGGSMRKGGNTIISGGTVIATAGEAVDILFPAYDPMAGQLEERLEGGAGIGTGGNGSSTNGYHVNHSGNITITGGNITATGTRAGAGIGNTSYKGVGGVITISGGEINATGGP